MIKKSENSHDLSIFDMFTKSKKEEEEKKKFHVSKLRYA